MQAGVVIFGIQIDDSVLYRGIAKQPSALILPCICPIFFLSILRTIVKCFVKDFCKTRQARAVIFGMQDDDNMLHRGITNQPSAAYSNLGLSDFLSFHTLNYDFFRQKFL